MKSFVIALALTAASLTGAAAPICGTAYAAACCKVCKAGKACGNTCISRDKACHTPKGCACNG